MQPLQSSISHIKIFNTSAKFTHILQILLLFSANLVLVLHAVIYSDRRARQSAIHYNCCSHTHKHHQNITLFEPLNTQSLSSRSSISSPYHRATQDLQPLPAWHVTPNYSKTRSMFDQPPTSQLHPCVKSPSLATSPSHTPVQATQRFLSLQNTSQLPAASSRIRTRHQKQYSTCRGIQLSNQIHIQHADRLSSMQMDR